MRIRCRQNAPACAKQAIEKLSVRAFVGSQIESGRPSQAVQDSQIQQARTLRAAKSAAQTSPDAPKSKPRRCTNLREDVSRANFDAESDFEVRLAAAPPKSIKDDEKLIPET